MGVSFEIDFADITAPSAAEVKTAVMRQFPKLRAVQQLKEGAWPYNTTYIFYVDPTKAFNLEVEHQYPNNFQVRLSEQSVAVLHTVALAFVGFLWGFTEYACPIVASAAKGARCELASWQAFIDYNYKLQASVKAARCIKERKQRTASSSLRDHDMHRSPNPAAALSPHLLQHSARQRRAPDPATQTLGEQCHEWTEAQLRATSPARRGWRPTGSTVLPSGGGYAGGGGGKPRAASPARQRSPARQQHSAGQGREPAAVALGAGEGQQEGPAAQEGKTTQCRWGSQAGGVQLGPDGKPVFSASPSGQPGLCGGAALPPDACSVPEQPTEQPAEDTASVTTVGTAASSKQQQQQPPKREDRGRDTVTSFEESLDKPKRPVSFDPDKTAEYIALLHRELAAAEAEHAEHSQHAQQCQHKIEPGLASGQLVQAWEQEHGADAEAAVLEAGAAPGGAVALTEKQKQELVLKLADFRSSPRALHKLRPKALPPSPNKQDSPSRRRMPQHQIDSLVHRLSRPSARADHRQFERLRAQAAARYKPQRSKSFVNASSREMSNSLQPIQDRAEAIVARKVAWREQQQQQQQAEVEAGAQAPKISSPGKAMKRTVGDLMRWQAKKQQNLQETAAQLAQTEAPQAERKFFNSRCSEIMSTERLFLGNRS